MSDFPVTIEGKIYQDRDQLVAVMQEWGSARTRRHPGDRISADRWNDAMAKDPAIAPAVAEAAAQLLASSADAGVLEMVAHLVLPVASVELYKALLDRLEGKGAPLPAGRGLSYGSLAAELYHRLVEWRPKDQPSLSGRARTLLQTGAFPRAQVAFAALDGENVDEVISALRRTPDLDMEPFLAVLAVSQAIRNAPERAPEVAKALADIKTSPALRELVGREIARILPAWHAEHGGDLRAAMGLSSANI
jgi:hypothetical protein